MINVFKTNFILMLILEGWICPVENAMEMLIVFRFEFHFRICH